jgi:hypothetical protein
MAAAAAVDTVLLHVAAVLRNLQPADQQVRRTARSSSGPAADGCP